MPRCLQQFRPTGSPLTCPWWCLRSIRNISRSSPVIREQRLGTQRGFIAVKSNCSLQSDVPALHPLREKFGVEKALVCTYQAISGAWQDLLKTWPEIVDNVIPYIGGEEEKSEQEPMKMWGHIENGGAANPSCRTMLNLSKTYAYLLVRVRIAKVKHSSA